MIYPFVPRRPARLLPGLAALALAVLALVPGAALARARPAPQPSASPVAARAPAKASTKTAVAEKGDARGDSRAEGQRPARVAKGSLYAIVLGPGPDWKKGQPLKGPGLNEHRRYWAQMNDEGRIASAGPLGNDTGLILMRAKNQAEANAAILGDPAVKARLFRGIARPYSPAMANADVLEGKGS